MSNTSDHFVSGLRKDLLQDVGKPGIVVGQVYTWIRDSTRMLGGYVSKSIVPLQNLQNSEESGLNGRYVKIRNAGLIKDMSRDQIIPLKHARPDEDGNFLFEPDNGGEFLDHLSINMDDQTLQRYLEACRFGEVNTYFHLDRIAAYIDGLLQELALPSLPQVVAVVNSHQMAQPSSREKIFSGGHYRLPSWRYDIPELESISRTGEIHLGCGRKLLKYGALAEFARAPYLKNASHLADIIYHEYGHHVNRHVADFQANRARPSDRQSNRKVPMDEGTSDYWTAVMLGTPHIWAWHKRHDAVKIHPRSLISGKTMADYDSRREADPHLNGTIWAATIWKLRTILGRERSEGERRTDLLVLKSLDIIGRFGLEKGTLGQMSRVRRGFEAGLRAIREADMSLFSGQHDQIILDCFSERGIRPE
ncbi:M36 family metallopeptidase [Candidatus Bathyarchaeota archaeon]|nr:M36 family metallopeptidase [Candidatus Bathyarchaeota archaeon]